MKKTHSPQQTKNIIVSDRVSFSHRGRDYLGYVNKKGRKYAYVVCDDQSEYKVPYNMLSKIPGAQQKQVRSRAEKLRTQFHVSDHVSFAFKEQNVQGKITRLNPKRAHIVCDNGQEYQVPYAALTLLSSAHKRKNFTSARDENALNRIAARAKTLIEQHALKGWSFQFDHSIRRAGCCQYDTHVISMSHEFGKHASDEDIRETLLHEIAHALVGKAHNHDAVWKARAHEIGCSGNRCHDIQFTLPRYIMTCENRCWIATAERRRRGRICKRCHGKLVYLTYTEERWEQEQAKISSAKG